MGNLKQGLAITAAAASALVLVACGSGDQRLCTEANWYQTGVYHAQQGYEKTSVNPLDRGFFMPAK